MEEWKRGYKPFMHIYAIPPIDLLGECSCSEHG